MSQAMTDQALREKLASDFIDSIAVLTPYTRVTREAKRRLVATLTQYGDTREREGMIGGILQQTANVQKLLKQAGIDWDIEAELKEK